MKCYPRTSFNTPRKIRINSEITARNNRAKSLKKSNLQEFKEILTEKQNSSPLTNFYKISPFTISRKRINLPCHRFYTKEKALEKDSRSQSPTGKSEESDYLYDPRIYKKLQTDSSEILVQMTKVIIEKSLKLPKQWLNLSKEYKFSPVDTFSKPRPKGRLLRGPCIFQSKSPMSKLFHNIKLSTPT